MTTMIDMEWANVYAQDVLEQFFNHLQQHQNTYTPKVCFCLNPSERMIVSFYMEKHYEKHPEYAELFRIVSKQHKLELVVKKYQNETPFQFHRRSELYTHVRMRRFKRYLKDKYFDKYTDWFHYETVKRTDKTNTKLYEEKVKHMYITKSKSRKCFIVRKRTTVFDYFKGLKYVCKREQ